MRRVALLLVGWLSFSCRGQERECNEAVRTVVRGACVSRWIPNRWSGLWTQGDVVVLTDYERSELAVLRGDEWKVRRIDGARKLAEARASEHYIYAVDAGSCPVDVSFKGCRIIAIDLESGAVTEVWRIVDALLDMAVSEGDTLELIIGRSLGGRPWTEMWTSEGLRPPRPTWARTGTPTSQLASRRGRLMFAFGRVVVEVHPSAGVLATLQELPDVIDGIAEMDTGEGLMVRSDGVLWSWDRDRRLRPVASCAGAFFIVSGDRVHWTCNTSVVFRREVLSGGTPVLEAYCNTCEYMRPLGIVKRGLMVAAVRGTGVDVLVSPLPDEHDL